MSQYESPDTTAQPPILPSASQSAPHLTHSTGGDLDAFLARFKPSTVHLNDDEWVRVETENAATKNNDEDIENSIVSGNKILDLAIKHPADIDTSDEEDYYLRRHTNDKRELRRILHNEARQFDIKSGKWFIYVKLDMADAI
jgi:hypothetical protein